MMWDPKMVEAVKPVRLVAHAGQTGPARLTREFCYLMVLWFKFESSDPD